MIQALGMCGIYGMGMMIWFWNRRGRLMGKTLGFWIGVTLVFLSALAIALKVAA